MAPSARCDPRRALALFYAAYFANMGILLPFLPPWLREQGMTPTAIGALLAAQPLAKLAAPWTWGRWADRSGERRGLLSGAMVAAALTLSVLGVLQPTAFIVLFLLIVVYAVASAPALPYAEATALEQSELHGFAYGPVRLWGSIAFIAAAAGFGARVDRVGAPAGFLVAAGLLTVAAVAVAAWPPAERRPDSSPVDDGSGRPTVDAAVVRLFIACALMQASHGGYYAFYSIRLIDLGFDGVTVGLFWAVGVCSEVLLLTRADAIVNRWGRGAVMRVSLLAAAVRWLVIAHATTWGPLVAAQTLHAFTYAAFHVAALREVHRRFPVGSRATGQALYSGLTYGAGTLVGTLLAGRLAESIGIANLFTASAGLALLGAVALVRVGGDR